MEKVLDMSKSVYELCREYPELIQIMAELGFKEISQPGNLEHVGKMMTIPKGSVMKHISMKKIVDTLREKGFTLTAQMPDFPGMMPNSAAAPTDPEKQKRIALLTSYIKRLGEGEDLESVRKDFVEHFKDVDAAEIAQAEQQLLRSGVPLDDVTKLCDVHAALFKGKTRAEKIANAEKMVAKTWPGGNAPKAAPLRRQDGADLTYQKLQEIAGHPLQIFHLENEAIGQEIAKLRAAMTTGENYLPQLDKVRQLAIHYAKKGDLIYPPLKETYGFSGPSDVMWSVDNEIRDALRQLSAEAAANPKRLQETQWRESLEQALTRAEEMIYKEENILLPLCAKNFSEKEWKQMARDMQGYESCLIQPVPLWKEAEEPEPVPVDSGDRITLSSGSFTKAELEAVLNTIPLELTFMDAENINRYFNDNGEPKLFKRPLAALGREVWSCHPVKIQPIVRRVIETLRSGAENSVDVWHTREGKPVLVRYLAVRDKKGTFLGVLETVQKLDFAKAHFMPETK